ncbi:MAG TPA: hypothetical protein VI072_16135 [Polyangiaceae bacterium]
MLGEWSTPNGAASVSALARDVVLIVMSGYVTSSMGNRLTAQLRHYLIETGDVHTFWDLGPLVKYDADVRTRSIQVLLDERCHIASMHAFSEAENVKLGVMTARIVLGEHLDNLFVHETRESFADTLAAMLAGRTN